MPTYTLTDLAKLADVTTRTIRYYIVQGLLPSPAQAGAATRYNESHLDRLLLIKKLQAADVPLAKIRAQLARMPDEQIATMAGFGGLAPTPSSAVDYIRQVLGRPTAQSVAPAAQSVAQAAPSVAPAFAPAAPAPAPAAPQGESRDRSQWERITLDPDIELHVRRPLTRANVKRVARLVALARQLFEED
jgi:DNA-binding transcriptional MerR regulator